MFTWAIVVCAIEIYEDAKQHNEPIHIKPWHIIPAFLALPWVIVLTICYCMYKLTKAELLLNKIEHCQTGCSTKKPCHGSIHPQPI